MRAIDSLLSRIAICLANAAMVAASAAAGDETAPPTPIPAARAVILEAEAAMPEAFVLAMADRVIVLSKTGKLLDEPLDVTVRGDGNAQLPVAGLLGAPTLFVPFFRRR